MEAIEAHSAYISEQPPSPEHQERIKRALETFYAEFKRKRRETPPHVTPGRFYMDERRTVPTVNIRMLHVERSDSQNSTEARTMHEEVERYIAIAEERLDYLDDKVNRIKNSGERVTNGTHVRQRELG